jgi:hypothetical protein
MLSVSVNQKSSLKITCGFKWNRTPDNQIVFDKSLENFDIDRLVLSHENQSIALDGNLKGWILRI